MREPTKVEKEQYERFRQLFKFARQRYLEFGGDPLRPAGEKYLTDEERKEFFKLGRQLFGVYTKDGYVHCQGRSWKMTNK